MVLGSVAIRTSYPWRYAAPVYTLIAAPANNERGPRYMEKALAAIHQTNAQQPPFTLVYGSLGAQIGLMLNCSTAQRQSILDPISANYPLCSLADVNDESLPAGFETWYADVRLVPELFPILRHAQFEDLLNHNFADPVSSLLRAIRPDASLQCRVEISVVPASRRRCHTARDAVKRLDREFFRKHHHVAAFFARNIVRGRWRWLAWSSSPPSTTTVGCISSRWWLATTPPTIATRPANSGPAISRSARRPEPSTPRHDAATPRPRGVFFCRPASPAVLPPSSPTPTSTSPRASPAHVPHVATTWLGGFAGNPGRPQPGPLWKVISSRISSPCLDFGPLEFA
jgi:hypothetical protein